MSEKKEFKEVLADFKEKRRLKKEEKARKEAAKSKLQVFFEYVLTIAVAAIAALVCKNYIGQPIIVSGESMMNTLLDHQVVWVNKVNYTPERFDVVTEYPPNGDKRLVIKRIIGLPGEEIYIDDDGKIYITPADGGEQYVLDDPYGCFFGEVRIRKLVVVNNPEKHSLKLGKDQYFVMGDNRNNSSDSRIYGGVPRSNIQGHAVFRIWPVTKLGNFDKK